MATLHVRTDAPAVDAPDADLADVGGVVKRADLELQGAIRIVVTHGNVLQDRVEDGAHVADRLQFFNVGRLTRVAREGRGVDHGEVQLVFRRAQLVEEVERLVHHPVRTRARTVDLVDDDDGLEALASAFRVTKRVCGIGPSTASTRSSTPSTIDSTRSTSPPKSACPGYR